jgi:hypothetical protein
MLVIAGTVTGFAGDKDDLIRVGGVEPERGENGHTQGEATGKQLGFHGRDDDSLTRICQRGFEVGTDFQADDWNETGPLISANGR